MAMKHRKLFPTNQTDCQDFCDANSCPYGCYPYADYSFPPLPPPPPLSTDKGQQVSPQVLIVVSLLASIFLLLIFYLTIVKCRNRRGPPPTQLSGGQDEDFLDPSQRPAPIDHPIWYINTVGLQPSIINSITVFKFKKGDVLIDGSEFCSVCLSEFKEDEALRLLPKCNHAFHIPCIDTWLRSHTNCPLCRAGILSNTWSATIPPPSNDPISSNSRPDQETQMENSEINGENRVETEAEVELPHVDDDGERKELVDDSKIDDDAFSVSESEVRRSVSMDISSVSRREDLQQPELGFVQMGDLENSRMNREMMMMMRRMGSIDSVMHRCPVSLRRSLSYGGRLFLPRHGRNSSSILPL